MISEQKKFIFIHISKTGGNAISSVLAKYSEDEIGLGTVGIANVYNSKWNISKHNTNLRYYKNMGRRTWQKFLKVSCIRNPFDRAISLYFFAQENNWSTNKNFNIDLFRRVVNSQLGRSQHRYLQVAGKVKCDYIMRHEHIDNDWIILCDVLDIQYEPLPVINTTKHEYWRVYYEQYPELIKIVKNRYQKDLDYWGYSL